MTSNQIAYWKLQEDIRSNQVKEAETSRANKAQEAIKDKDVDSQIQRRKVQNISDSVNTGINLAGGLLKSLTPMGKIPLGKLL